MKPSGRSRSCMPTPRRRTGRSASTALAGPLMRIFRECPHSGPASIHQPFFSDKIAEISVRCSSAERMS